MTTLQDADLKQMQEALIALKDSSRNSDVGVLFYSGHGLGLDGDAYLIPVDATFTDEASAKSSSLSISFLLKDFLQSKRKIVFYDADLANPFETYGARTIDPSPKNTLISYAAMRGEVVLDGDRQKNSPFTTALLQHLDDPQDIAIVLRKVRERVVSTTNGKQEPWEYGSLTGGELVLSRIKAGMR